MEMSLNVVRAIYFSCEINIFLVFFFLRQHACVCMVGIKSGAPGD